jgi:formate dehydrogenase subunit delta
MSAAHTGPEHLIHMANDIAHFFAGSSDRDAAILGIANHMKSFWTAKMRRKLISDFGSVDVDEALEDLPREALRLLREHPEFKPKQVPEGNPEGGGDAG